MRAIWITWERHRRTREIARALNIRLVELLPTSSHGWKYVPLLIRTTLVVAKERPTHLLVQCPSIVLGVWTSILRVFAGYALIVDLHNAAVTPMRSLLGWHQWLTRTVHRTADLCVITNEGLRGTVESNGGRAFVLPDKVPDLPGPPSPATPGAGSRPAQVAFVCSFGSDEPYRQVVEAARHLAGVATIHVTGNSRGALRAADLPANVTLTGFLADEDYERLLADADVIVDLTTRENCLLCGAYEALALAKPFVTSDTAALRRLFPAGAVFTSHDPESIARAIRAALNRSTGLISDLRQLRAQLDVDWEVRSRTLWERLHLLNGPLAAPRTPSKHLGRTGDNDDATTADTRDTSRPACVGEDVPRSQVRHG